LGNLPLLGFDCKGLTLGLGGASSGAKETFMDAFDFLKTRQSQPAKAFKGAVPDRAELMQILTVGTRVPDHGKLEPWRLVVLDRAAMPGLADLAEARAKALGGDEVMIAKGRGQFDLGQLAVAVISSPKQSDKVPLAEQVLSAGALCMTILTAAQAKGWGANWLTGWVSHDAEFVRDAFGCGEGETVAGIVHIGTVGTALSDRPRPDLAKIMRWL
jgi:nitroreductase